VIPALHRMQLRRVVVTGLGALTPLGNTLQEYWEALAAAAAVLRPSPRFDPSKFKTHFACEVKGFNPEDFIDRKEARKMDPYTQFAVVACR
jgi:3-oxoacyl-[acyl-carrier-protein] synthase II